jgi:TetR/AcrR family transcriptional regulator, transcriptional repressor for nem operon
MTALSFVSRRDAEVDYTVHSSRVKWTVKSSWRYAGCVEQPEAAAVERERTTSRGVATRQRILDAACDLIFERGVAAVALDDILAATGTSKSQLYHYFADRSDLIRAVVARQGERVLDQHRLALEHVDGWEALGRWRDFVVGVVEGLGGRGGCPVGSLADEVADVDEQARVEAASVFEQWQALLAGAFRAMVAAGQLQPEADLDRLALATLASLEGGLLLSKTARSTVPVETALDAAITNLRAFAVEPGRRPQSRPRAVVTKP